MEKLDYETPQPPQISDRWGCMSASLAGASAVCLFFGIAVLRSNTVLANDITLGAVVCFALAGIGFGVTSCLARESPWLALVGMFISGVILLVLAMNFH